MRVRVCGCGCAASLGVLYDIYITFFPPFSSFFLYSVTLNSQAPPRTNAAAFYSNGGVGGAYSYYSNGLLKNANNSFCCDSAVESCKNGTQLQNASDSQLPCLYWGEGMAEYPAPTNAELVLTSRVSISTETAAEGCTSADWGQVTTPQKKSFFRFFCEFEKADGGTPPTQYGMSHTDES